MLDTATKRRIDTARDILVGKVPDPKSQVEQITIALIYKFMDDMDIESEELGGLRTFFANGFSKYSWAKLMRSGLGGHETLNLYAEAIAKMPENPGIPPLFRSIFKNAYLPYRDPEILKIFLKVIDEFEYDHSERLGDAFEYLLSVLGSQGGAGQFRTPRHIIDFMVKIMDPKKDEKILDPACGTAGFLISSYKHIIKANKEKPLTPSEREVLARNIKGYDISPDMVRLSLVNLYLHGFNDPHIEEYDTLTSEDKWNEYADVILANPPFMSPKGGIKPHKRFTIQAKRSEVLFVDYMAEHLTPNGRAAIIVPEGIIFNRDKTYRQLRKMLVENSLLAVISLPAGVFNPYSPVKTSILILDKSLAKQSQSIGFFKVESDGFSLGAQRRETDKNDLPQLTDEMNEFLRKLRNRESLEDFEPSMGLVVPKEKIAENGDFNLSRERHREGKSAPTHWPLSSLRELCVIESGSRQKGGAVESGIPSIGGEQINENGDIRWDKMKYVTPEHFSNMLRGILQRGDVLLVKDGATTGKSGFYASDERAAINEHVFLLRAKNRVIAYFLYQTIRSPQFQERLRPYVKGIIGGISLEFAELGIPLPPLEVQQEIVAEIEGYQKVIDGARAVIDNYKPQIPVDPEWPIVEIDSISTIVRGSSPRPQGDPKFFGGPVPRLMVSDITRDGMYATPQVDSLTELGASKSRPMNKGDVVITVSGNPGLPTILAIDACIHDGFVGLRDLNKEVQSEFLYFALLALHANHGAQSVGAVFKNLTTDQIRKFEIALPSRAIQQAIVAEIEAEQALVNANRELIERFEKKIQVTIGRVWGENDNK